MSNIEQTGPSAEEIQKQQNYAKAAELSSQLGPLETGMDDCTTQKRLLQEKVDALTELKGELENLKGNIKTEGGGVLDRYTSFEDWKGSLYSAHETVASGLDSAFKSYAGEIDGVLDAVCDEITRLNNLIAEQTSKFSGFQILWNNLKNEIAKLLN